MQLGCNRLAIVTVGIELITAVLPTIHQVFLGGGGETAVPRSLFPVICSLLADGGGETAVPRSPFTVICSLLAGGDGKRPFHRNALIPICNALIPTGTAIENVGMTIENTGMSIEKVGTTIENVGMTIENTGMTSPRRKRPGYKTKPGLPGFCICLARFTGRCLVAWSFSSRRSEQTLPPVLQNKQHDL